MSKFSDLKPKKKEVESFIDGVDKYHNNKNEPEIKLLERLNVEVPIELHKAIKIKAANEGIKIRQIVISALQDYLVK